MLRFTIRDVLWATVVVAISVPVIAVAADYKIIGEVTKEDLKLIEDVVKKLNTNPILKVEVKKPGTVDVTAGIWNEPLGSSITTYTLEKRDGKWIKIKESGFDT